MSLYEDIAALLEPVAPGGAWFGENPAPKLDASKRVLPYLVWLEVIGTDEVDLDGPLDMQRTRLQVDVFAPRVADADVICHALDRTLLRAVQPAALAGGRGIVAVVPISRQGLFESAARLARIIREYSVTYRECDDVAFFQSTLYAAGMGKTFNGSLAKDWTHELAVFGEGAVTATGVVEGTNDPTDVAPWQEICTLAASGTDAASASPVPPVASHEWLRVRHRLTAITGTNAFAQFNSTGQQ